MDALQRRVVVAVVGGHLLICLYLAFGPDSEPLHTTKPLVVKTIEQQSSTPSKPDAPKPGAPKPGAPRPTPPPPKPLPPQVHPLEPGPPPPPQTPPPKPQQQEKDPAIQEKRPTNKKQPAKPSAAREKLQKELMRELEAIEGKKPSATRAAAQAPRPLQLSIDRSYESDGENSYEEKLIAFLHTALHLPDLGAVRLQLTVRPDGSLSKLLVIKAESEKNRKYLEENLPRLRFPPPSGGKERNLLMTFFNEVN